MRYGGVYRGLVTDNADPERRGRVRVQIPSVGGQTESWAPVCKLPGAAGGAVPVGATAIVAFEGGDPARPIVLGYLI